MNTVTKLFIVSALIAIGAFAAQENWYATLWAGIACMWALESNK